MEKTELLLQMMEHPHEYTHEQWEELLEDEECRQLYSLLSKTKSVASANENDSRLTEEDVDKEWKRLAHEYPVKAQVITLWRKVAADLLACCWFRALPLPPSARAFSVSVPQTDIPLR